MSDRGAVPPGRPARATHVQAREFADDGAQLLLDGLLGVLDLPHVELADARDLEARPDDRGRLPLRPSEHNVDDVIARGHRGDALEVVQHHRRGAMLYSAIFCSSVPAPNNAMRGRVCLGGQGQLDSLCHGMVVSLSGTGAVAGHRGAVLRQGVKWQGWHGASPRLHAACACSHLDGPSALHVLRGAAERRAGCRESVDDPSPHGSCAERKEPPRRERWRGPLSVACRGCGWRPHVCCGEQWSRPAA